MKLKHIKFVERYLERGVVALAAIFFLLVLWFFFVGGPYDINMKNEDLGRVSPDRVEEIIADKAQTLKSAINMSRSPLPPMTVQAYTDDFERRVLQRSLIGVNVFDLPFGQPGLDKDRFIFIEKPPPHYYIPTPDAPKFVKAHADHYVLDETKISDPQTVKAYEALIGTQQPRDFRSVTVSAVFDMEALQQAYMSAPPDQRIPRGLMEHNLDFADVILERQTLNPATGRWGEDTIIQPLPDDIYNYRNTLPDLSPSTANRLVQTIRLVQDLLARPNFAPVESDRPWNPPAVQNNPAEGNRRRAPRNPYNAVVRPAANIPIWAHDITVRPGATYRYRMSVCMLNPLFRNPHLDNDQYQTYFNALMLPPSLSSAWTPPITIDQESYFFVAGANPGRRTAEVEVWRIFDGAWRSIRFNVQPGDVIDKIQKMTVDNAAYDVDFRINDKLVVDIDFNAPSIRSGNTTVGLIVLDEDTGAVQTKTVENDDEDLTRSRLRAESTPPAVAEGY